MSNARFCIIPARAIGDQRLNRTDIMVLNCLGLFGDKHGWCFPSTSKIAETIKCHRTSVSKSINILVQAGYVEVRPRFRNDGGQTSNEYRILFDSAQLEETPELDLQEAIDTIDSTPYGESATPPCSESAIPPVAAGTTPPVAHTPHHINEPTLTTHVKKDITPKNKKMGESDFETFWQAWPKERRCEKPVALHEWKHACTKATPADILSAQARYLTTKEAKDGFAPYPARWLKRERWLEFADDAAPPGEAITLQTLGGDTEDNRKLLSLLDRLRQHHGEALCKSWFSQLRVAKAAGGEVIFIAPSRFTAEWINSKHGAEIQAVAKDLWKNTEFVKIIFNTQTSPLPLQPA